ncbi:hypothetical protein TVAG_248850 [Trichomonas vaginalis G3]|uniref:Translin-associated factor X-interacting protein 1 N-terminal domain-containing protein n=1 Tax=Trichomonas vaginalis (strain ATCC PRA-98 / G3) TaxID=412133 RepID=A2DC89_TRIV3|nr:translin-associated factor X-interacting N-terminus family [Trichomonas vaginalis G3]EAY21826.1 hypothetical protein TVAG_248850 [Trichomonas vaginalis G3]KAI5487704.1 translin-associated factor X-interacting N-terminus family [Trichomonas vaginalis G3]|eukprot:XP_001582812.1 hypothetical protein [Trichomonas vaginalis G3]
MAKIFYQNELNIKSPRFPHSSNPRRTHKVKIVSPEDEKSNDSPIEKFLRQELPKYHSDSDTVNTYQRAFDMLILQFQACRPILEQIKQEYDTYANELIKTSRDMVANLQPETSADDSYAEVINTMRQSKEHEFAEFKEESERKLDLLTTLRLKHNELVGQITSIKNEYEYIQNELQSKIQQIAEITNHTNQLSMDTMAFKSELVNLQAEFDERKQEESQMLLSIDVLNDKKNQVMKNTEEMKNEIASIALQREKVSEEIRSVRSQFDDVKNLFVEVGLKNQNMDLKLSNQAERIASLEQEIRAKVGDQTTPIDVLLSKYI